MQANRARMPSPLGLSLGLYDHSVQAPSSCRLDDNRQRPLQGAPDHSIIPLRAYFFVLADEIDPFSRKVVRKVAYPTGLQNNPELLKRVLFPERYGFFPRNATSQVGIAEHVGLEMTDSRFISASERAFGSRNYPGKRYWIDVGRFKAAGGIIHEAGDIASALDTLAAKTTDPRLLKKLRVFRHKSLVQDREVLLERTVPASAVKGVAAMGLTRGLQFVQGIGLVLSAYDLGQASMQSVQQGSIRPVAAESVRQSGSWGSAAFGGWAAAWAAAKLGAVTGGMFGLQTGPGAVVAAGFGAAVFGTAGYFGWDWVADFIYEND